MKYATLVKALDEYTDAAGDDPGAVLTLLGDLDALINYPDLGGKSIREAYIEVLEYKGVRYLISDWDKVKKQLLKGKVKC